MTEAYKGMFEGKLDDFDKAYDTWHEATVTLTKAINNAATNKKAVSAFKKALDTIEKSIDNAKMQD